MGDDEHVLERVGRPRRPALWIGAWVVGLVAVVGLAVVGREMPAEDLANVPAALPVASPAPEPTAAAVVIVASPGLPEALPRVLQPRTPRVASTPRPARTLGDDGLVGGTVYSSPGPARAAP